MTDNPNTPSSTPTTPDAPETRTTGSADAPKTFTESEVNAMVTARLAKQEKALKAQLAEEAKTIAERAKLDEVERVKAEKADIEQRAQAAEARAAAAERRAALTGKVNDLALAEAIAAKYTSEDGTLDVDALLKAHPSLAATRPAQPVTTGASTGMPKGALTPEDFRGKSPEWIRANLDQLPGRTNQ